MAYIDLETDKARIRVLFGKHGTPLPAAQLPENCTGVLFEGPINPHNRLGEFLNKGRIIPQHREIIHAAQALGIPVMPAEIKRKYYPYSLDGDFLWQTQIGVIMTIPLIQFHSFLLQPGAIQADSFRFRTFDWMVQVIEELPPVRLVGKLRNLIMADGTFMLADFQRQTGTARPLLALSVGSMHTGTVRALRMSSVTRNWCLKNDPNLEKYYDISSLSDRHFFQYNQQQERWEPHALTNWLNFR